MSIPRLRILSCKNMLNGLLAWADHNQFATLRVDRPHYATRSTFCTYYFLGSKKIVNLSSECVKLFLMATITKSDELRLHNRSRILTCLRVNGRQSRTNIGEITGLSGATVTQVTADLIEDGVIEQVAPEPVTADTTPIGVRRGRPQVILRLNTEAATAAVLTLLLNQIEVTLYDYAGNQLHRINKRIVTSALTPETLQKQLIQTLDSALAADDQFKSSLKHIALVCQGTVTSDNSGLLWSPITGVRDIDFGRILQDHYAICVTVSNDCNMIVTALYQERQTRSSAKTKNNADSTDDNRVNFAAILLSYGIGLGFFHKGSILAGSHSSGTEFGHMLYQADGALCRCGRHGCIEAYASDYAIWRSAKGFGRDTLPEDFIPQEEFEALIDAAINHDGPERAAFNEAGAAIGQGLTNLFAIFDPFPTVLVGTSSIAFDLIEDSMVKNLRHYGIGDSSSYVSVYNSTSENDLIRSGASLQALSYIDKEIFSFGERTATSLKPVAT